MAHVWRAAGRIDEAYWECALCKDRLPLTTQTPQRECPRQNPGGQHALPTPRPVITISRELADAVLAHLVDNFEAVGGCDHSVNICVCDEGRVIGEMAAAVGNAEVHARFVRPEPPEPRGEETPASTPPRPQSGSADQPRGLPVMDDGNPDADWRDDPGPPPEPTERDRQELSLGVPLRGPRGGLSLEDGTPMERDPEESRVAVRREERTRRLGAAVCACGWQGPTTEHDDHVVATREGIAQHRLR